MSKIPELNGDRKVAISLSTLWKLVGVVLAVGIAYATATTRIEAIENGITKSQETLAALTRRVDRLETTMGVSEAHWNERFHSYDLRMQSIEERIFGQSRSAKMRGSESIGSAPVGEVRAPIDPLPYPHPYQQEEMVSDRRKQYRDLRM